MCVISRRMDAKQSGDVRGKTTNELFENLAKPWGRSQPSVSRANQPVPANASVPAMPASVPAMPVMPAMPAMPAMLASAAVATVTTPHELWAFNNALFFIVMVLLIAYILSKVMGSLTDIKNIKADWANQRCNPTIMPFASLFGENTKENFEFCMGSIFNMHSLPMLGSMGTMFSQFTDLLNSIFNSINSLRNIIATLGGGINVIFQEFTDRITTFFFKLRLSAIHMKALFGRLYAVLFSVMYMGMSGITGMTSFTNTFLFSFLDTFCFPGETEVLVKKGDRVVPVLIKEVKIGDVLMPGSTTVTSTFEFYSRGQAMVQLGNIKVSTNHYLMHEGRPIMAGEHPAAIPLGPWDSDEHLYCLNTTDHTIPMGILTFLDYDETPEGDAATFRWIEKTINAKESVPTEKTYEDACFAIEDDAKIRTMTGVRRAADLKIGERLSTGCTVVGLIRRKVTEVCTLNGVRITPATLYWNDTQWKRLGEHKAYQKQPCEMVSFVVVPHSQLELEDGTRVRDYMEVCSPDAEQHYSALLESA